MGFLVTNAFYTDFDLEFEFWVTADANSGAFIRCANPTEIGAATCYEVNIFDQRPDPKYRTGAIVDVAEPKVMLDTGGRWNSYAISARGPRLIVTLNGQQTVDVEDEQVAIRADRTAAGCGHRDVPQRADPRVAGAPGRCVFCIRFFHFCSGLQKKAAGCLA